MFHKRREGVIYSTAWPVDPELLEILACPNCKTPVTLVKNGAALKCATCKRVYPIKDDIPVMLIDEATIEECSRVIGLRCEFCSVRLRQIGDVVFTTPAIHALRQRFPDAHLTYIVEPAARADRRAATRT